MIKSFYSGLINRANQLSGASASSKTFLSGRFLLRALVSVGILAVLVTWLSTQALADALLSIHFHVWIVVGALFVLGHVISAMKWRLMLKASGVMVGFALSIRAHFAGLFANLCLPSIVGGDVIRAALVMREQRGEIAAIALGSLTDRLNDIVALLIIAGIASLILPASPEGVPEGILVAFSSLLLLGIVVCVSVLRFFPTSMVPMSVRGIFRKVTNALDTLVSHPAIAMTGLTLSVLIQGSFVGLNVVLANAIGIEAPVVLWMFAWPMAKLIALAPVSLGGLGVREAALAALLVPFGIDASVAVAQSLSWEIILILTGLISGMVVAMTVSRPNNHEQD